MPGAKTWHYCTTCGLQLRSDERAANAADPEVAYCPIDGNQLDDGRRCPDPDCRYHKRPVPSP